MSNKTSGPNSLVTILENAGANVQVLKQTFNPLGTIKVDRTKFSKLWQVYDLNQNCNFLKWNNLPNGLTSWNLNRMLYYRGTLCGFKFNDNVYILPYTIEGMINPYGLPTKVRPITYNGQAVDKKPNFFMKDFELSIDLAGNENITENTAYLLYDSVPMSASGKSPSRFTLNKIICDEIATIMAKINVNVKATAKKFYFICKDPKQAEVIKMELAQAFENDSPFEVLTNSFEQQVIQNSEDLIAGDYFNIIKNWDSVRCFMNGIKAKIFGEEKKERLITAELEGSDEQVDFIADVRLMLAKEFADNLNKSFGTNITVELNRNEQPKEEYIETEEGDE